MCKSHSAFLRGANMAKDDYFVIAYQILSYLY
nr:MAG TPA_asm: hypothetical protein [Caudoviricetes sp.]